MFSVGCADALARAWCWEVKALTAVTSMVSLNMQKLSREPRWRLNARAHDMLPVTTGAWIDGVTPWMSSVAIPAEQEQGPCGTPASLNALAFASSAPFDSFLYACPPKQRGHVPARMLGLEI
jgi:hypothetical protein